MPWVLGRLQDAGIKLTDGMMLAMLISAIVAVILIWLGPETRGRQFTASDAGYER
jgi:hypothetical protein